MPNSQQSKIMNADLGSEREKNELEQSLSHFLFLGFLSFTFPPVFLLLPQTMSAVLASSRASILRPVAADERKQLQRVRCIV